MKKKDLWRLLTLLVVAATVSIGFTACGGDDEEKNEAYWNPEMGYGGGGSSSTGGGTGNTGGGSSDDPQGGGGGNEQPSDEPSTPEPIITDRIDGYQFVDLGLSVKWSTGEPAGYYQYGNPTANSFFSSDYDLPNNEIGGQYGYDPATTNLSPAWRMPTRAEMQELVDRCDWYLFTSGAERYFRVVGPSGEQLTLRCYGAFTLGLGGSLLYENYQCWLLTSTLDDSGNPRPYILKARYTNDTSAPDVQVTTNEALRLSGIPIRGVSTSQPDIIEQ